jgi:hypothetical protein
MLSFGEAISKVLPSITRDTVPTISAAIAVIGIAIARQQTRTVALVPLRFIQLPVLLRLEAENLYLRYEKRMIYPCAESSTIFT